MEAKVTIPQRISARKKECHMCEYPPPPQPNSQALWGSGVGVRGGGRCCPYHPPLSSPFPSAYVAIAAPSFVHRGCWQRKGEGPALKMLLVLFVRVILERNVGQKGTGDDQKPAVPPPAQQDWGASYAQRLEDPILSPEGEGKRREGPKNSVAVVDQCHRTRNGHGRRDSKKQTAKSCFCPPPLLTLFSLPT